MTPIKAPCKCATTANITLSGLQTLDGITVSAGDRVLVRSQSNAAENGIYIVSTGAWTQLASVESGALVWVYSGNTMMGWHQAEPATAWNLLLMASPTLSVAFSSESVASCQAEGSVEITADFSGAGTSAGDHESQFGTLFASTGESAGTMESAVEESSSILSSAQSESLSHGDIAASSPVWIIAKTNVQRYDLGTDIVSMHTALSTSQSEPWAAAGNSEKVILGGGTETIIAQCIKYTYATEVTGTSATLGDMWIYRSGMQSATTGYFIGGVTTVLSVSIDKVLFSTEGRTAGTSLQVGRAYHASQGNTTRGISAGGTNNLTSFVPVTTTSKYTYATDTRVGGSTLSPGKLWQGAAGNTTEAIFSCGTDSGSAETATSKKYTYAGDTVTSATSLLAAHATLSGGGTNEVGLFHGPTGGNVTTVTNKYTFATSAVVAGTDLYYGHNLPSMKAEAPGGL